MGFPRRVCSLKIKSGLVALLAIGLLFMAGCGSKEPEGSAGTAGSPGAKSTPTSADIAPQEGVMPETGVDKATLKANMKK